MITIYQKIDIASFCACEFTVDLNKLQNTLKMEIFATQQWYQLLADVHKILGLDFQVRQQVYVKA